MHKILLVDDMRRFLDLTQTFLSRSECSLLTASTGLEAIKVARTERPDLIVLDIEMPEMNGIDACRILKADPEMAATPIIMLTSLSNREEEARRAGASGYLRKPVDEETFLRELVAFLPIIQRKEKRHGVDLPAIAHLEGRALQVRLSDLSRSGTFILGLPFAPTIADQFSLTLTLPGDDRENREVNARAVVVRSASGGTGVRFLDLTSGATIYIEEYLQSLDQQIALTS